MSYESNKWLEKYEIKKPDYDYIDRVYIGMKDSSFPPARYTKCDGQWKSKKNVKTLFGKKKAKIMFLGDITCFEKQIDEAKNGMDYDFAYEFDQVKPVFAQADLVVGNLETMIFPEAPYRTEKYVSEQNFHCNGPIEFLDAIRKAGVDMLTNANNHDLDTGAIGIGETIDYVEKFGFIHTGTFKTDKKRYEIVNVNGIKVGIVAFATEHNNKAVNLTQEGVDFLLNDYNKERAATLIKQAREDGAEVVFVCIHWGKENKTVHNDVQTEIAKDLIELGYDCIIGSHPHVLQPFTVLEHAGRSVPVFYSMGNFVSHNANNAKARSIIACIDLERKGKETTVKCSYIPIFTSNNFGAKKYVVLPIPEKSSDLRNAKKYETIKDVLGVEIQVDQSVQYSECKEKLDLPSIKKKAGKFDVKKIKSFPSDFDDGKFVYSVYEDYAVLVGLSSMSTNLSYSVSEKLGTLPIKAIHPGAFEGNELVKKVNFRKNIPSIPKRAFKNCTSLEGFQLGGGVKEIEEEAFSGCTSLSAAVMKRKTTRIKSKAFANCTNLRCVKLPKGVVEIAPDAFDGCESAVFYCPEGSYAEQYAKEYGFKVINMDQF